MFKIIETKFDPKLNFVIGLKTWQKKYTIPNHGSISFYEYKSFSSMHYYGFVNV